MEEATIEDGDDSSTVRSGIDMIKAQCGQTHQVIGRVELMKGQGRVKEK